jgi:hypothetical protein
MNPINFFFQDLIIFNRAAMTYEGVTCSAHGITRLHDIKQSEQTVTLEQLSPISLTFESRQYTWCKYFISCVRLKRVKKVLAGFISQIGVVGSLFFWAGP